MNQLLALFSVEFCILRRNRWLIIATGLMAVFALALTLAGSANSGALRVDLLTLAVASMTTLAIYLVPLLALLMAFEAISGDAERGALDLILSYPVSRGMLLAGKFLAHLAGLSIAVCLGFGIAGLVCIALGQADATSLMSLIRLIVGSVLLGASFLALGYMVSALSPSVAASAGAAGFLWLVLVVLFDLVLLAVVIWDNGGAFSQEVFPWILAGNPADALRLFMVSNSVDQALATGMHTAAETLPKGAALASLLIWPMIGLALARLAFARRIP